MSRATDHYVTHGSDLLEQYHATGSYSALTGAVDAFRQLVMLIPERSRDAPTGRFLLCMALKELYEATKDIAVLQESVDVGVAAARTMSPGAPSYATGVLNLAIALRELGKLTRNLDQVDGAIGYGRWAVGSLGPDHKLRPDAFIDLAAALHARYKLTGDLAPLYEAVTIGWQALAVTPERHPRRISTPYKLSEYLAEVYRRTQDPPALDDAIKIARWGAQISYGDPHHADHLRALAGLLQIVDRDRDELDALREAIHLLRTAAAQLPRETTNAVEILMGLGSALESLGRRTEDTEVMRESVHWLRHALAVLAAADPHGDLYGESQYSLGTSLLALYKQTTESQALDDAVLALRAAVAAMRTGDSDRYRESRASLAAALLGVFDRDHAEPALDEAIELLRDEVGRGDAVAPIALNNLAAALLKRFDQTGELAHVEEAIALGRRAVESGADDPSILSNLAVSLNELFLQTGQRSAADEALVMLQRIADTVPDAPAILSSLSVTMSGLAERLRNTGLKDEAAGLARRAVAAAPYGHYSRPLALNNLGSVLTDRFSSTGRTADMREAIAVLSEAVDTSAPGDRGGFRYNLARAKAVLGEADGDAAPIGEAVLLARQALGEADSPAVRARISVELARWLNTLMIQFGDQLPREEVLNALEDAIATKEASPYLRLQAARSRAEVLAAAQRWPEALDDYVTAVNLIGQVAARHLAAGDKQHGLAAITSLGTDAAACALNAGQPRRAIELAEHARGVLLAEAFDTHADLTELRACAPGLVARLISLRDQLNEVGMPMSPAMTARVGDSETIVLASPAEHQHRLGQQWNDLLSDIRGIQGFETFLLPLPMGTLTAAATDGPVALLNVSMFRCDALVLRRRDDGNTDLQVIRLPGVDASEVTRHAELMLSQSRREFGASGPGLPQGTVPDILEWLWDAVIEPVLAGQGLLSDYPPISLPRIWWCPTGFLSCLPLHAAGRKNARPGKPDLCP